MLTVQRCAIYIYKATMKFVDFYISLALILRLNLHLMIYCCLLYHPFLICFASREVLAYDMTYRPK